MNTPRPTERSPSRPLAEVVPIRPDAAAERTAGAAPDRSAATTVPAPERRRFRLGLDRFSGLYVWVALIVVFGAWMPDLFLTGTNARVIAGDEAITAILALGLVIPLAAGVFDLSIAATMGFSAVFAIWYQSTGHNPLVGALLAVLLGAVIGAANGFVVVRLHVDSFIATLGSGSILAACAYWISNGQQIVTGISPSFLRVGTEQWFGIPAPVWYMAVLALLLWVFLEFRPGGRYLYAVGGNPQAARLAGVRVDRVVFGSLVASATIAGLAGVVLAAKLGTGNPTIGPAYLLPAFSAVFLGATQIKAGRVNVLGTLIAIYLLATGIKGLQLAGAPVFVNDLFNGFALILAVALAARTAARKPKS
jgi:ribose transport system permease protein